MGQPGALRIPCDFKHLGTEFRRIVPLRCVPLHTGKPANIVEKIVDGKVSKYYEEHCLLEQPFVKDTDKTIQQLLEALMARTGEKCEVRRFARFQLGEEL